MNLDQPYYGNIEILVSAFCLDNCLCFHHSGLDIFGTPKRVCSQFHFPGLAVVLSMKGKGGY
jgi:hypothetical protein